jgi:hypothetical protein
MSGLLSLSVFHYIFYEDIFTIHGGFIVTIPIRLLFSLVILPTPSLPLNLLPTPLKTIAGGVSVLSHVSI